MITIELVDKNLIAMRCHYAYRGRCHNIPGAIFDRRRKSWVAPLESLPYIMEDFEGELYFKTPLWKLLGQTEPKKVPIEYIGRRPKVPDLLLDPYEYQREGIRFMVDRLQNVGFVLNGDQVGLGKTLQSIGAVKWHVRYNGAKKILIIAKKSAKTQWAGEIERIAGFDEDVPVFVTGSTKKKRYKAYEGARDAERSILVTNFHNFLNDAEEISKIDYDLCVIDEAHCLKAREGKLHELVRGVAQGRKTILLTGTPIMSRPDDIWGIIDLVSKDYFGSYEEFKAKYIVTEFGIYGEQIIGARNLNELQERIQNILIMRTAEEVALNVPERRPSKRIVCDMDETQRKMQRVIMDLKGKQDAEKENIINRCGQTAEAKAKIEEMNELGKMYLATLQFIADDPSVFRYLNPEKGVNKRLAAMVPKTYTMSQKTESMIDVVSEVVDAGEKIIVFCHYASSAKMLRDHFQKIDGANVVMYTGLESDEVRDANVEAFKYDPECNVLIGTEAMAESLNLQVARFIAHYEQADTYAIREQRIGRIKRLGSEFKFIVVIDLITDGSHDVTKIKKLERDFYTSKSLLSTS